MLKIIFRLMPHVPKIAYMGIAHKYNWRSLYLQGKWLLISDS